MNLQRCNIILPPVWSGVYFNTSRLLTYSLEDNGYPCQIIEAGEEAPETNLSFVLGWNLIPDSVTFNNPYIICQLEPLCLDHWREKLYSKLSLFKNAYSIWDYTSYNQKYLSEYGLNSTVVPLGYHPKLNEITHNEFADYDVLFVGFITERRQKILEELNKYCCVSVQPRWGKDYKNALCRSKILLNIHQYDIPTPIEQPRIAYALNNRCFVLSEESLDNPYEHLMTCTYENLTKQILHFLHQPKLRIEANNQVFKSFKQFFIKTLLQNILKCKMMDIFQHSKNTLSQAATSQPTNQSLQESIFSSALEKLKNTKYPSLDKNKTLQPHSQRLTCSNFNGNRLRTQHLQTLYSDTNERNTEALGGNSVYVAIAGEVVNRRSVHLSNFVLNGQEIAPNPLLHIHATRYKQA